MGHTSDQLAGKGRKSLWLIQAANTLWDSGLMSLLSSSAIAVLFLLVRSGDSNGSSYRSVANMADLTGLSRSRTIQALRELESHGMLRSEPRVDADGRRTSELRTVLLPNVATQSADAGTNAEEYEAERGGGEAETRPHRYADSPLREQGRRRPRRWGEYAEEVTYHV